MEHGEAIEFSEAMNRNLGHLIDFGTALNVRKAGSAVVLILGAQLFRRSCAVYAHCLSQGIAKKTMVSENRGCTFPNCALETIAGFLLIEMTSSRDGPLTEFSLAVTTSLCVALEIRKRSIWGAAGF